ncbi:MAG: 2-hydroxyacyl-CoA dehydratase subunit D, partial [Bacillota bacterium]
MNNAFADTLAQLNALYENRCQLAAERKEKSEGRVIGYLCSFVPEEILYAAGVTPFRITGDTQAITEADARLPNYYCSFARSCLNKGLGHDYGFMDGLAVAATCDTITGLHGIWSRNIAGEFKQLLAVPMNVDGADAQHYFTQELDRFKQVLERFTGEAATENRLWSAIELCNQSRLLLDELSQLRAGDQPRLSGTEFFMTVRAGMVTPKDEYNNLLKQLISSVPIHRDELQGKSRVIISGSEIEDIGVLELIEDAGALIIHEDTCYGYRYYGGQVDFQDDPLRALASRYLDKVSCPCKHSLTGRLNHLLQKAKELDAHGVIFTIQKFCDPHLFEVPYLKDTLNQAGIPVLVL